MRGKEGRERERKRGENTDLVALMHQQRAARRARRRAHGPVHQARVATRFILHHYLARPLLIPPSISPSIPRRAPLIAPVPIPGILKGALAVGLVDVEPAAGGGVPARDPGGEEARGWAGRVGGVAVGWFGRGRGVGSRGRGVLRVGEVREGFGCEVPEEAHGGLLVVVLGW